MRRRETVRKGARRGQGGLESVLVLLVFLAILIGVFDLGQVLFIHQTLTERSRNAARYGVVHPTDTEAIRNMVLYNQTTVPEGRTSGIFGLTSGMVSVARESAGTSEERVVVTISNYPYRFFTPLIARAATGRPIRASMSSEAP